jgi:uncharacterized protein (TIGR04255 family)
MLCFPPREDIPLGHSPLTEVICQVRFPRLLRIANEEPVEFQEKIREPFPQADIDQGVSIRVGVSDGESVPIRPEPRIYRFRSSDHTAMVSLASSFYAVSTKAYTHWQSFLGLLELVNQATRDIYDLPYATRIGLRYTNNITPENTGLTDLSELLNVLRPEFTALLRVDCWDEPLEMLNQLVLSGEDNEKLTLRSGYRSEDTSFILDFDYYIEGNVSFDDLSSLVGRYHDVIYYAFRWCIRDEALSVFGPAPGGEGG